MNSGTHSVQLALYDLTNGMARQMSPFLLGKTIDAVYHSSIIVYGIEYFFGGGICQGTPGLTPYGSPINIIDYGETEIPKEAFNDFLKEIDSKYNFEKYHILENNCNHFTNEICEFLTGKSLPDNVVKQHEQIMDTSLGQFILPMLQNMNNSNNQFLPQMYEKK